MIRKTLICVLALLSALGSTAIAHASTLEDRVELRRLERLGSSSAPALYERVQKRLQERVDVLKEESPEEYERVIEMLKRREDRRKERLSDSGPSLKIQVADAVNMERAKRGIPAFKYHPDLERSAQAHANDMITRDYFSHENPEGERSGDRIKKAGYGVINAQECRCSYKVYLGENIAKGQTSVEQVIREWMESDSHREAMLSRDYKDVGVGISGDIWVLNFGSVDIHPVGE